MKHEIILKTIKDVFEDENGKYWFDIAAYLEARENPKSLSNKDISIKVELSSAEEIESEVALYKRIERFNKYVDECKGGSISIDTIKLLGRALKENEMAFLIPVSIKSFVKLGIEIQEDDKLKDINIIYDKLNRILYMLEPSYFYNFIPDTDESGREYYDRMITDIRKYVDKLFWNKQEIRKQMYELVNEVEYIINSCSVPGVPDDWIAINSNIKYFDCVYDIIDENPELYEKIRTGNTDSIQVGFSFYPTTDEINSRKLYFEDKKNKYPNKTIDRLYQEELVETLNMRFNKCVNAEAE